jgi:hypothetical protein
MVSPLRSDVGDLEAPTTYVEDIDGGPSGPLGGGSRLRPWSEGVL